jgi:hypothetical protein
MYTLKLIYNIHICQKYIHNHIPDLYMSKVYDHILDLYMSKVYDHILHSYVSETYNDSFTLDIGNIRWIVMIIMYIII